MNPGKPARGRDDPRPTRRELAEAEGRRIPDVIGPGVRLLFCGINPSLYAAVTGWHFGRPGNRFWPVLHEAGFTPRLLHPSEQGELIALGCGITNLVARATAGGADLSPAELRRGRALLEKKIARFRPRALAVLGVTAYRTAFGRPRARMGRQAEAVSGARLWVLPNPSGRNAHYQLPDLVRAFQEMREGAG